MIRRRLKMAGVIVNKIVSRISPGGHGMHVLVYVLGTFNRYQIIALESLLESDHDRAAQDFRRAGQASKKEWRENWHVLFDKK